jgi:hypothetical protein
MIAAASYVTVLTICVAGLKREGPGRRTAGHAVQLLLDPIHRPPELLMRLTVYGFLLILFLVSGVQAQSPADSAAIRATALDYVEGWYEGNAERMARALHAELVKRIVVRDTTTGKTMVQGMGASVLLNSTRHGYGKETPKERQQKDVRVLDIFGSAASAKAVMADWVDYMQLAKVDGRWVIVNVLWERKPKPGSP